MWRMMGVLVAVVALVGLTVSHGNLSAAPGPSGVVPDHKQLICHVADNAKSFIIEVDDTAVPAHLEEHGDCLINSTDRSLIHEPCNPTDANGNDICDVQP